MTVSTPTLLPGIRLGRRAVLMIAVPIMASNFSELLIGFVDTAILGQLGDA
jgi:Na+-driven multidrug efflux pump